VLNSEVEVDKPVVMVLVVLVLVPVVEAPKYEEVTMPARATIATKRMAAATRPMPWRVWGIIELFVVNMA